jgi:PAP2 superfamily/Bacterial Ig-like domain
VDLILVQSESDYLNSFTEQFIMTEDLFASSWLGNNSGSSALFPNSQLPIVDALTILAPHSAATPLLMQPDGCKISTTGTTELALPDLTDLSAPNSTWGGSPTSINSLLSRLFYSPLAQNFFTHHPIDRTPPKLAFGLLDDTGSSNKDRITSNPSIQGTVKDNIALRGVQAQLDNGKSYSINSELNCNGKFILDRDDIQRINGGMKLADGQHTIKITAADFFGNKTTSSLDFTLDTTAPTKATIALDVASDSGTVGDYRTNNGTVTLTGKTEANTQLKISQQDSVTGFHTIGNVTSDANGNYQLTGVNLAKGINSFTIQAKDLAGNTSTNTQDIRRIAKDDAVITWNQILLNTIATTRTAPPVAARAMAMVETAVFDAVNNIVHKYQNYSITATAPIQANAAATAIEAEAAAVEAAYTVLSSLFASQKTTLDAAHTSSLAAIADGQAKADGIAFGKSIADKVVLSRVGDGSANQVVYTPGTNPGDWQTTAVVTNPDGSNSPAPAVLPQWGNVKTFGIPQADVANNRPAPPPALTSEQYAKEFNQVKELGAINSTTRTAEQTEIAKFWVDGAGTFTPPGHWNQIAQDVARDNFNSLIDNARLFAALDVSQADAAICCWDTKYTYSRWRPITAIRNADKDDNANTTVDTSWTSLLTTPNFPAYTSGHSTFSASAAAVLTSFYGDNYKFSTTGPGLPGVTRSFTSFNQAAEEAGMSRVYGGIHFMSDNSAGLAAGKKVGEYITTNLFKAV